MIELEGIEGKMGLINAPCILDIPDDETNTSDS